MQRTTFTTAIVRFPPPLNRSDVISRAGHQEPNGFARAVESMGGAKVVSVRHEQVRPDGRGRRTVAVFPMASR
jgi:hypothetical protein